VSEVESFITSFKPVFTQENLTLKDRLDLLKSTVSYVNNHNSQGTDSKYSLAVNELSAYSQFELKQRNGFRHITSNFSDFSSVLRSGNRLLQNPPMSIDWAEKGAVTSIKNQQQCGGCWAIAAAGAIEGAAAIDTNFEYVQSLSFQQLLSCDTSNYGCDGGSTVVALQYTMNNALGGLTTYEQYPFEDSHGVTTTYCRTDGITLAVIDKEPTAVTDTDTGDGFSTRVSKMKQALVNAGPVAIAINADCQDFISYASGVLTTSSCACSDPLCLNHAVLLVGYNDTNDPPYWKIKNSWGECWGESGFVRVSQEQDGEWGKLGMLAQGVLPLSAYNVTAEVSSARPSPLFQLLVVSSAVALFQIL
jgi:cysteine peptidase B